MERGTKGRKGRRQGEQREVGKGTKGIAPCIYVNVSCMLKKTERLNDAMPVVHIAVIRMNAVLYIIITRMNVVNNLNSV